MSPLAAAVVYLNAPRSLEVRRETIDADLLAPADILCETLITAISPGTELAAYTGLPPLKDGAAYPRVQGYCNVARVLAVGAAVTIPRVGDRVLSFASHRSHFVLPAADVLLILDPGMAEDRIACAYLFHLGYNAVLRAAVTAGSRVLVIGQGALGIASTAMAALAGARVWALSDHPEARRRALAAGAREAHARRDIESLRHALTPALADVVIVTTNGWEDWSTALELAAMRGTIACLGFPGRSAPPGEFNPLSSRFFYVKQLRIEAVGMSPERAEARGFLRHNERDNLRFIAELLTEGRLDSRLLVSGEYAGTEVERAYRDLLARKDSPITYLLRGK